MDEHSSAGSERGGSVDLGEAQFRAVAETARDAIVTIDLAGRIVYVNPEARRLFGFENGELLGAPVTSLMPARFHQAHLDGFARYLATGEGPLIGTTTELWARRRDETELPIELSLATWEAEGARYFTAIIRDVSERRRAQELERALELERAVETHMEIRRVLRQEFERVLALERAARKRLQELDELKNTFLEAVSHELRSPLATVRVGAGALQRDLDHPALPVEQRHAYVREILSSVHKMSRLLDQLLGLERLASGQLPVERRPTDLGTLVVRVVTESALLLDPRVVDVSVEPVVVPVDAEKIEWVVENLLTNAARHTPPGTPVWVFAREEDGGALLGVDDAGPGVPPEERERIFDRFHRSSAGAAGGLGIGLSVVARLAALHGGRAWVEERPGGGAAFRVLLPAWEADHDVPVRQTGVPEARHANRGNPLFGSPRE
jgi:PAS domain S-box-containing protein